MFDEDKKARAAGVIRERIEEHGVVGDEPGEMALYLAKLTRISEEKANALLWGEEADFEADELDRIASALCLHRGLVGCFLVPTSREILEANLVDLREGSDLHPGECDVCFDISTAIDECKGLDDEQLFELAHDALAHALAFDGEEPDPAGTSAVAPVEEGDFEAWVAEAEMDLRYSELIRVFELMDDEQRNRLMSFAYAELSGGGIDVTRSLASALSLLRSSHLTPLSRRALDALASSETGSLRSDELQRSLGLESRRSLGQLERNVRRGIEALAEDGIILDSRVLVVKRQGSKVTYEIEEEVRHLWRGMMRAEQAPRLSQ